MNPILPSSTSPTDSLKPDVIWIHDVSPNGPLKQSSTPAPTLPPRRQEVTTSTGPQAQKPHGVDEPQVAPEVRKPGQPLNSEEQKAQEAKLVSTQTSFLKNTSMPLCLRSMIFSLTSSPMLLEACQAYRDDTLQAAGSPTDPVEVMLLEQMMILQHVYPRVLSNAFMQDSEESKNLMINTSLKMLGQFRQHVDALSAYREPRTGKNRFKAQQNLLDQQNIAAKVSKSEHLDTKPEQSDTKLDSKVSVDYIAEAA